MRPPDRVPTSRIGDHDPRPVWLVLLTAALLVAAVLKPWSWAGLAASGAGAGAASPAGLPASGAEAGATADVPSPSSPTADEDPVCVPASGWRLATVEGTGGSEVRTWYSLGPVEATSPLDPDI
ncbi:MAG TPA: hypothetical protein VIV06_04270, partial [Candidatus Limnocylindrales bacterium]